MAELFTLLENGKIKPLIFKLFPLAEAVAANKLVEPGEVTGNIVLINE